MNRTIGLIEIFEHFSELLSNSENNNIDTFQNWRTELHVLNEQIKENIIFNKRLVNLVNADVVYYLGFDSDNSKFTKKEKRYLDISVRVNYLKGLLFEGDNLNQLDYLYNIKDNFGTITLLKKDYQDIFSRSIFENDKKTLCYTIFINNEPYSLLYLSKIESTFKEDDYKIGKTISQQIREVLQVANLRRKAFDVTQNLSHQAIAPLAGLDSYLDQLIRNTYKKSDLLYYEFKNEEKKQFVYRLLQSQMANVRYVLSGYEYFLALELGKTPILANSTFSLVNEIENTILMYQPITVGQKLYGPLITYDQDYSIHTDKTLLKHIISCLIDNAIKYSDKETTISINISSLNETKYKIQVLNFGLIIQESEEAKIFNKYFRSDDAKKRYPHGGGIGLFLVKQFCAILGGDCYLEKSSHQEGTILSVELRKYL